jgi:hypothetical protein
VVHDEPFQVATNVSSVLAAAVYPTAVHDDAPIHETPVMVVQAFAVGAGTADHDTPFHRSAMGGVAIPLTVAPVPIAMHASAPAHEIIES